MTQFQTQFLHVLHSINLPILQVVVHSASANDFIREARHLKSCNLSFSYLFMYSFVKPPIRVSTASWGDFQAIFHSFKMYAIRQILIAWAIFETNDTRFRFLAQLTTV